MMTELPCLSISQSLLCSVCSATPGSHWSFQAHLHFRSVSLTRSILAQNSMFLCCVCSNVSFSEDCMCSPHWNSNGPYPFSMSLSCSNFLYRACHCLNINYIIHNTPIDFFIICLPTWTYPQKQGFHFTRLYPQHL